DVVVAEDPLLDQQRLDRTDPLRIVGRPAVDLHARMLVGMVLVGAIGSWDVLLGHVSSVSESVKNCWWVYTHQQSACCTQDDRLLVPPFSASSAGSSQCS